MLLMLWEIVKNGTVTSIFMSYYMIYYKMMSYIYRGRLTPRQETYLLSLKSSLLLSLCGIYFNGFRFLYDEKTNVALAKMTVNMFNAYLITDLYLACTAYNTRIQLLEGYIHHSVYIFVNIFTIYTGYYVNYVNYMLLEVPTFFMGLGTLVPSLRHDNLFGSSFFLLRILYHSYLSFLYRKETTLYYCSNLAFLLHAYWFKKWVEKYGHALYPHVLRIQKLFMSKNKIPENKIIGNEKKRKREEYSDDEQSYGEYSDDVQSDNEHSDNEQSDNKQSDNEQLDEEKLYKAKMDEFIQMKNLKQE